MKIEVLNKVIIALIVIFLLVVLYLSFGAEKCVNFECFQENMIQCGRGTTYVNEESEASWGYEIKGKDGNLCEVEVTLLSAKEGSLDLRQFEGNSMSCFYDLGVVAYPEKDLDTCHGQLKENLQTIIIENLHKYIVDNLGEIQEGLKRI
jgi:hypothetical protein